MAAHSIKKYANRKLYDLTDRRYVTLQTVADLLSDGFEVEITDQSTGEDITVATVAQALGGGPAPAPARPQPQPPSRGRATRAPRADPDTVRDRGEQLVQRLAAASFVIPRELGQRAVAAALDTVSRGARGGSGDTAQRDAIEALREEVLDLRDEVQELREELAILKLVGEQHR
jgi:hypothetical protein